MNSPEVKAFIRQHSNFFWYIPEDKKEDISPDLLVEFILNYGDMNAVKDLFSLSGIKNVADLFFNSINLSERRKGNFNEITINVNQKQSNTNTMLFPHFAFFNFF